MRKDARAEEKDTHTHTYERVCRCEGDTATTTTTPPSFLQKKMASAAADTSDGDMPAVSNEELDIVWDTVVRDSQAGSARRARSSGSKRTAETRSDDDDDDDDAAASSSSARVSTGERLLLGLEAGDLSFDVPELRKRARRGDRVPAEDGTWVEPGSDPTEGGRYGPQWREEAISRQKILEADPNFQFLSLVAGAANTRVSRLYDENSVGEAMRARISEGQARLASQEAQIEAATLERSLAGMRTEQTRAERSLGRVTERQRTDGLLRAAPRHVSAVQTYVDLVRAREVRVDVSNVLERWAAPAGVGVGAQRLMAADMGSLYRRVLDRILEEDDDMLGVGLGADEGLRPATLALPLLFPRPAMANPSARAALTDLFRSGFPHEVLLMGEGDSDPEATADESAPPTLERALGRLIVLRTLASDDILSERRSAVFSAFAMRLGTGDIQRALSDLTAVIDGEFRVAAIASYRQIAWQQWRAEAAAVANVLESALFVLQLESPLASPSPGSTFKTSDELAQEAAELAERRARVSGMSDAVALQEGQTARDRVLENPPNRIMVRSTATLALYGRYVLSVRALITRAEAANEGVAALRAAGVLGSPALDDDLAVLALARAADSRFSTEAERAVGTTGATRLASWAGAMSWYEDIGGTLFVDLETDFPASDAMRAERRAGREITPWGIERRLPPVLYSAPMRALWDRHVPEMRAAIDSIEKAVLAKSIVQEGADPEAIRRAETKGLPRLTRVQRIVYTTLTGGIDPVHASTTSQDRILTRGPLIVFAVRLYQADLVVTRDALERAIEQRRGVMEATRDRLDKMVRGQPVVRSVPEIPYQHLRGWVERPENSGVVSVLEIVVFAIGKAWNNLQQYAPHVADVMTIEDAQRDPTMRVDFAELVAVRMALSAQRFQKQWTPLKARMFNVIDLINVMQTFQKGYALKPTGVRPPRPQAPRGAPGSAWRAEIIPVRGARRGRSGGDLLVL